MMTRGKSSLVLRLVAASLATAVLLGGCKEDDETDSAFPRTSARTVQEKKTDGFRVTIKMNDTKIDLAKSFYIEFDVTHPADRRVEFPMLSSILKDMIVSDYGTTPPTRLADGRTMEKRWYLLEPFTSGTFTIPSLKFSFEDASGKKDSLLTDPVKLEVTSIASKEAARMKIHPIEDILPPPPSRRWFWIGIGALPLAAAAVLLLALARKKRIPPPPPPIPPHVTALKRLKALAESGLLKQGRIKEFHFTLSDIVRFYIEDRFGLHAPERTTEEFLHEISRNDKIPPHFRGMLDDFLRQCDMVKFAKYTPEDAEIEAAFNMAREFVEKTKP